MLNYTTLMKVSPSNPSISPAGVGAVAENAKESVAITRTVDTAKSEAAKLASGQAASASAQVDVRNARMNELSDAAWINEPPALDTAMLEQIKSAIREGRFVIDEKAIASALAEDASR